MYLNVIFIKKVLTEELNLIINECIDTQNTFTYNITKNHIVIGQYEKDDTTKDISVDLKFELIIDKITGISTIRFKSIRWSYYSWISIKEYLQKFSNCTILQSYIKDPLLFYTLCNIPINYSNYFIHDDELVSRINNNLDEVFQGRLQLEVPDNDLVHLDYESFTCKLVINNKISNTCKVQIYLNRHRDKTHYIDIWCKVILDRLHIKCSHRNNEMLSILRELRLLYNLIQEEQSLNDCSEDVLEFIKLYEQYAKE